MRWSLRTAFLLAALLIGFVGSARNVSGSGRDDSGCGRDDTGSGRDDTGSGNESLASGQTGYAATRDSLIMIRLFSAVRPDVVLFTPVSGDYVAEVFGMEPFPVATGEPVLLFSVNGRVGVKSLHLPGVMADGVRFAPAAATATATVTAAATATATVTATATAAAAATATAPAAAAATATATAPAAATATAAATSTIRTAPRFSLAIPGDTAPPRIYSDALISSNEDGIFLLLNETPIENYLPGVVRTEGGTNRPSEFCKAQAVLARTYAWLNLSRHISDGYHLCDDVHCQASYGVTDEQVIVDAVRATAGIVVTGSDSVLVQAAYHSNCGGQTASAADTWLADLPHLQSITDPYCVTSRNSSWNMTLPAQEWQAFLTENGYTGPPDSTAAVTFEQKSRKQYFEPGNGTRIAVTDIRNEFGLRSSFFSLSPSASSIVIDGRGYGHGVGLCQEGAIVMASQRHTWREIIAFYYRNVLLIDITAAKFPVPVR
ncbi:MAG: SpoIID/LytB domain-containing protein [Bacteroidales bacterium]